MTDEPPLCLSTISSVPTFFPRKTNDAGPGNSYTWVDLEDDLTVSLLQGRLIERNLGGRC